MRRDQRHEALGNRTLECRSQKRNRPVVGNGDQLYTEDEVNAMRSYAYVADQLAGLGCGIR